MTLPVYLTNRAPSLDAILQAASSETEDATQREIELWQQFVRTLDYDELELFFMLFKIEPLFTRIFTVAHMQRILNNAWRIQRLRGTRRVLEMFSAIMNISYSFSFQRDRIGRKVALEFFITPPSGVIPGANWQLYMRRAFTFLVPGRQALAEFRLGLELRIDSYFHTILTPVRHTIPTEAIERNSPILNLIRVPQQDTSVLADWSYELTPRGGTPPYSYDFYNMPNWVSINGNTLSGTPPVEAEIQSSIILKDSAGARASHTFDFIVGPRVYIPVPFVPPMFPDVNVIIYQEIDIDVAISGGTDTITYTVTGLVAGLAFDANTLKITGLVTTPQTITVTVTATDIIENDITDSFDIVVGPSTGPLQLPQPRNVDVRVGDVVSIQLPSAFGGNPPYRVYAVAGSLGDLGLVFDTRSRTIQGTVTNRNNLSSLRVTYFVRDEDSRPTQVVRRFNINVVS